VLPFLDQNILTELGIQDMRFVGELRYGKYADDFENVHPDILQRYANEGKRILLATKFIKPWFR
jgi:hypothetical protein